jgi:hypothetical protein
MMRAAELRDRRPIGSMTMTSDPELLLGMSDEELEALAECKLSPSGQSRLDELLDGNTSHRLSAAEEAELDHLLSQVDHLSILKARARLTLSRRAAATGA